MSHDEQDEIAKRHEQLALRIRALLTGRFRSPALQAEVATLMKLASAIGAELEEFDDVPYRDRAIDAWRDIEQLTERLAKKRSTPKSGDKR